MFGFLALALVGLASLSSSNRPASDGDFTYASKDGRTWDIFAPGSNIPKLDGKGSTTFTTWFGRARDGLREGIVGLTRENLEQNIEASV